MDEQKNKYETYKDVQTRHEKKFRFAKKMAFLTYKTHLDKSKLRSFLSTFAEVKRCEIAHENGDEVNPYHHTHVFIHWEKQIDQSKSTFLDIDGIHPNIKNVGRKKEDITNLLNYLAKEDPENAHLKTEKPESIAEKVWNCNSIQEVAMLAQKPGEVQGLLALHDIKQKQSAIPKNPEDWLHKTWQNQLWKELFEIDTIWDKRALRWIIGKDGGEGKSLFIDVLKSNERSKVLAVTQFAGQSNIAEVMKNALASGWTGEILAVDLPRDAQNHQLYEPLEAIMNGNITATKYKGTELCLNTRPKVFVMANFEPERSRMSKDRWWISTIEKTYSYDTGEVDETLETEANYERNSRIEEEQRTKIKNKFVWGKPCAINNITLAHGNPIHTSIHPYIYNTPNAGEPEQKKQRLSFFEEEVLE